MFSLELRAIKSRAVLWLVESIQLPEKISSRRLRPARSPRSSGKMNSFLLPKFMSLVIMTPVVVSAVREMAYPG